MSKEVVISLFGPAIHPELWMRVYNSLSSNRVPFEMIFVGNKIPKFNLPKNCHFIYSETKPAQCVEIGSRYAVGDLIIPFADDIVFSQYALDNLYEEFNKINNDKIILSCRYVLNGKDIAGEAGHYWAGELKSPTVFLAGLMKKEIWKKIGGIDKRFIAQYWDIDVAMRVYEIGGEVILSKNAWAEELHGGRFWERKPRILKDILVLFPRLRQKLIQGFVFFTGKEKNPRLYLEFGGPIDRPLLDQFWVIKKDSAEGIPPESIHCIKEGRGILSKIRLLPVMPFEDKHILTVSQGSRGRWK